MDLSSPPPDSILDVLHLSADFSTRLPIAVMVDPSNGLRRLGDAQLRVSKLGGSPRSMTRGRKQVIVWIGSMGPLFASFAASCYAPAKEQLIAYWGLSEIVVLTGITAFTTGFAFAPMILAPISETWGRRPVLLLTGLLFILCQIGCAVTTSFGGMITARLLAGVGSSTFVTIFGGVLSDIYHATERNDAMAIFSGTAIFGTGLGPIVCGLVAEKTSWRWIFWIQVVIDVALVTSYFFFVPETRESTVLRHRCKALQSWSDDQAKTCNLEFETVVQDGSVVRARRIVWTAAKSADMETGGLGRKIFLSTYRPFQFLFTEPIVFFFSLWAAFSWCILYVTLAAVPLVFMEGYGFSLSSANAVFASSCIASVAVIPISILQERWLDGVSHPRIQLGRPERRLYFSCVESLLLPAGLFMFGWSADRSALWVVPAVALGLATAGIFSVYLAVFNYLADTYHTYASSALAAQSFCRNAMGGVLPLVTRQLFTNLGYGPASGVLGGIGLILTLGPWVLAAFGEKIRHRSKFASEEKNGGDSVGR